MEVGVLVRGDIWWASDEKIDVAEEPFELQEVLVRISNLLDVASGCLGERTLHHLELYREGIPTAYRILPRVNLRLDGFCEPAEVAFRILENAQWKNSR